MALDEKSLRRPSWVEGDWVTLGDGQAWCLPRPRLRLVPVVGQDGQVSVQSKASYGAEINRTLDEIMDNESDDPMVGLLAQVRLTAVILSHQYQLTSRDLAQLVTLEFDDEGSMLMWRRIGRHLLGKGPEEEDAKDPKGSAAG